MEPNSANHSRFRSLCLEQAASCSSLQLCEDVVSMLSCDREDFARILSRLEDDIVDAHLKAVMRRRSHNTGNMIGLLREHLVVLVDSRIHFTDDDLSSHSKSTLAIAMSALDRVVSTSWEYHDATWKRILHTGNDGNSDDLKQAVTAIGESVGTVMQRLDLIEFESDASTYSSYSESSTDDERSSGATGRGSETLKRSTRTPPYPCTRLKGRGEEESSGDETDREEGEEESSGEETEQDEDECSSTGDAQKEEKSPPGDEGVDEEARGEEKPEQKGAETSSTNARYGRRVGIKNRQRGGVFVFKKATNRNHAV